MSDFRELYFIKTMRNAVCYLKVHKCMKKKQNKNKQTKKTAFLLIKYSVPAILIK